MPTKRKRGNSWTYIVKRKGLLPRPLSFTFSDEAEGDDYVARVEKLLDAGIVPAEFKSRVEDPVTISDAIEAYLTRTHVKDSDVSVLDTLDDQIGKTKLSQVDYAWVERYVKKLKHTKRRATSTIKHHVGALARMLDWMVRSGQLVANPLRLLPAGYASYNDADKAVIEATGEEVPAGGDRDRRLSKEEETKIRERLSGDLLLVFDLALETGMRMREIYTTGPDQVDIAKKTIFLEKTKNGDKRQVPMSSVAVKLMKGFKRFPWWDGTKSGLRKTTSMLSGRFARVFEDAGCPDLRFHDLRHEACCRLYERTKLSDVEIAKMMGWKSMKMALRYANLRGSDIAGKLW